jgi:hypothetical protein
VAIVRARLTRRVARSLRGRKVLRLGIEAQLTDAFGNSTSLTKKGVLKRPRR